jgi:hypothetical protein
MSSVAIACLVFACCFCAALAGLYLRVPADHLDSDSKDTVRLVMGLIATISALVLSLLISSANSTYDTQASELRQVSADIVQLDRMLVLYGPETQEIRDILRQAVIAAEHRIWPPDGSEPADLNPSRARAAMDAFYAKLQNLTPKTAAQSRAQDSAWQLAASLTRIRMLMYEQTSGSVSWPLLGVLTFWVSVLFLGFGLFSRFHTTLLVAMFVGALSVGGAIFLILELNRPYEGLIHLSDAPVRNALAIMER